MAGLVEGAPAGEIEAGEFGEVGDLFGDVGASAESRSGYRAGAESAK